MKYFYLIVNSHKKDAKSMAFQIRMYLEAHGCVCAQKAEDSPSVSGQKYTQASSLPDQTQCVITLGGDGTLIQAARDLADKNLPLAGVNMGTLGYLTQVSGGEVQGLLDALITDNYQLEKRMMLEGGAYHMGSRQFFDVALNDIVLTRKDLLCVLRFGIYVNGDFLNEYRADGMIIATPTGSTAYNLSAGGPIAAPGAQMILLTPICPHTLNARSIVLSPEDIIRVEIRGNNDDGQVAVFDGDTMVELSVGDYVEIRKSQIQTTLVKLKNISFLDNLRDKMASI